MAESILKNKLLSVSAASILSLTLMTSSAYAADLFTFKGSVITSSNSKNLNSRNVKINPSFMSQTELNFELNGINYTAKRNHISRQKGTSVWTGRIQGADGGELLITSHKGMYSGTISLQNGTYRISGDMSETQSLSKLNLDNLPNEDIGGLPDGEGQTQFQPLQDNISNEAVQQDILMVYTQAACDAAANSTNASCNQLEADIVTSISQMNQAYAESEIDIFMNITSMRFVNYADTGVATGTALSALRSSSDGIMDEVHGWREEDGADLVALIMDGTGCGIAYSPAAPSSAFSVTDESCMLGNRTLAHEIGHNQGALHDRDQHSGGTVGAYNYGFKRCADGSDEDFGAPYFRTIMSYGCTGASRVGRYSNPNVLFNGVPQGTDPNTNPDRGTFNARTLNESAAYVASFRQGATITTPIAPSGLNSVSNSASTISLSWSDNSDNETRFTVERSTDGASFTEIANLGSGTISYTDSGLDAETTYYYRVRASNSAGASDYSNVSSATTDSLPNQIEDVAISQTLGSGTVTGSYPNTHTNDGSVQRITEVSSGGPKRRRSQSYSHSYNFNVTGGAGGVTMKANAYVSGTEGALFEYSANGGASWTEMFVVNSQSQSNEQSFVFPSSTSGNIVVRVTDAEQVQGETTDSISIDSLIITSNTIPATPPNAPSNLSVGTVTANSVALSFTDNSSDELGFEVWRSQTAGSCGTNLVGTTSADETSFVDNSAAPSTIYFYTVSSFNSGGSSVTCTDEVTATTLVGSPISASGTGYKVKGQQTVDITWSGTSGSNVDIIRDGRIITTTNNDGSFTDNIGVKGGGSYQYAVCESGSASLCSETFNIIF